MDENAWRVIITGWERPMITKKCMALKPKDQRNATDNIIANLNSKVLNVIFSRVDDNQFKLNVGYGYGKEASDIL